MRVYYAKTSDKPIALHLYGKINEIKTLITDHFRITYDT